MAKSDAYLVFTLHTHLPFVLNHGRWPHGSDWLCEVAVECYLPLLAALRRLADEDVPAGITINFSPILCEQLDSAAFREEIDAFLTHRREACESTRRYFVDQHEDRLAALCDYWAGQYDTARADMDALHGDILGAFKRLAGRGTVELITTGATHGYMPLLSRDESVDLQFRVAVATHRRHFGAPPRGAWLPECAYRPRYEWTPPVGPQSGKVRYRRRGVEELLAANDLGFFFTDTHLVRGGRALSAYGDYFPRLRAIQGPEAQLARRGDQTAYVPHRVASRGGTGDANALVRDPEASLQVWSRDTGYPGDGVYLEFHKRHFPGGLRLWRVTDSKADLGQKQIYEPERAAAQARVHADHFVGLVRDVLGRHAHRMGGPGVLCAPFDTELFGHWWGEGPIWLEHVLRLSAQHGGVVPTTSSACLEEFPVQPAITLLEGSWGEGGDHRVWLNKDTEWTWEMVYQAEDDLWTVAADPGWRRDPLQRRLVSQLARELLLMQASDWQFLITTWAARNYAETRFAEHCADFRRLLELVKRVRGGGTLTWDEEQFLGGKETQDFCFPDIADHVEAAAALPKA
jgi:1,4-alpha-glucan branching enzyme